MTNRGSGNRLGLVVDKNNTRITKGRNSLVEFNNFVLFTILFIQFRQKMLLLKAAKNLELGTINPPIL